MVKQHRGNKAEKYMCTKWDAGTLKKDRET